MSRPCLAVLMLFLSLLPCLFFVFSYGKRTLHLGCRKLVCVLARTTDVFVHVARVCLCVFIAFGRKNGKAIEPNIVRCVNLPECMHNYTKNVQRMRSGTVGSVSIVGSVPPPKQIATMTLRCVSKLLRKYEIRRMAWTWNKNL